MASKHPWLHHNDGLLDFAQFIDAGISYPEPSTRPNDSLYNGRQQESGTHRSPKNNNYFEKKKVYQIELSKLPGHELISYQSSYELTPQQCTFGIEKKKFDFIAMVERISLKCVTFDCKLSHIDATEGVMRPPKSDEL